MMAHTDPLCWEALDSAVLDTGDTVVLRRRGVMYDIRFNGVELMSNADPTSELELGRAVVRSHMSGAVTDEPPCVLIGGLGMGFTLRSALDVLPTACEVHVCEAVPKVVQWNQGEIGHLAGWPLRDPRVRIVGESVQSYMARIDRRFDVVLMDTDNGPDWIVRGENAVIYGLEGLTHLMQRLKPQGVAGFWSTTRSRSFEGRLSALGLIWQAERVDLGAPGMEPFHIVYCVSFGDSVPGRPSSPEACPDAR